MAAPKIVIVGGGVGGVSAAQQLAKANFADVTVIDRSVMLRAKFCCVYRVSGAFDGGRLRCLCALQSSCLGVRPKQLVLCVCTLITCPGIQEGLL